MQPQILRNFTASTETRASPMCSPKQIPGTYVPRLKCQSPPWKESLLVIGKTEQRAAGAGREHRGEGPEVFPVSAKPQLHKAAFQRAPSLCYWSCVALGKSPQLSEPRRLQLSRANAHRSPGRNGFLCSGSSCPGTAVSEDRGALVPVSSLAQIPNNSDLSPDMDVSIIIIMGGGHQKESVVGSEDDPQRRRSRSLGNG